MEVKREYHGIPLQVITDYLVELGGAKMSEDCVGGDGWNATLRKGEPFILGGLQLVTVHVHLKGDETVLKRLLVTFDLRMIRAGG
jgi:hypothetical protein